MTDPGATLPELIFTVVLLAMSLNSALSPAIKLVGVALLEFNAQLSAEPVCSLALVTHWLLTAPVQIGKSTPLTFRLITPVVEVSRLAFTRVGRVPSVNAELSAVPLVVLYVISAYSPTVSAP